MRKVSEASIEFDKDKDNLDAIQWRLLFVRFLHDEGVERFRIGLRVATTIFRRVPSMARTSLLRPALRAKILPVLLPCCLGVIGLSFSGDRFLSAFLSGIEYSLNDHARHDKASRLQCLAHRHVLAGEPLGLETARDLFREVRHAYPELVDELFEA